MFRPICHNEQTLAGTVWYYGSYVLQYSALCITLYRTSTIFCGCFLVEPKGRRGRDAFLSGGEGANFWRGNTHSLKKSCPLHRTCCRDTIQGVGDLPLPSHYILDWIGRFYHRFPQIPPGFPVEGYRRTLRTCACLSIREGASCVELAKFLCWRFLKGRRHSALIFAHTSVVWGEILLG